MTDTEARDDEPFGKYREHGPAMTNQPAQASNPDFETWWHVATEVGAVGAIPKEAARVAWESALTAQAALIAQLRGALEFIAHYQSHSREDVSYNADQMAKRATEAIALPLPAAAERMRGDKAT